LARNGRDVEFTTSDDIRLQTWMFEPAGQNNDIAVLYLPGNGANRLNRLGVAQAIVKLGYTVLLVEYRGYGGNPGEPTEDGLLADASAALSYLVEEGFELGRIIYVGESIGTGVAVQLASNSPPAGVLLRSPFTSLVDVAKTWYPWLPARLLMIDRFDTMTYLPQVTVPVTVLAGSADDLVSVDQSRTVADKAPNLLELVVVEGAGHNDSLWFGSFLAEQIDALAQATVVR